MDLFPKFIIEDGNLILSKVTYHKELVSDKNKVKGGGWFVYKPEEKTFIFNGESHDFGKASFEDIKTCIINKQVYSDSMLVNNISELYTFAYNTGSEIIKIK